MRETRALSEKSSVIETVVSSQSKNNYFTEVCSGSEAGSYVRLIDFVSLNSRLESNREKEE